MKRIVLLLLFAQQLQTPTQKPHTATLSWTQGTPASAGDCAISSNKIYRGFASHQETLFATTPTAVTTYTDSPVTAGTTYYYQVTAVSCAGESPRSNEVHATIPHKPPQKKEKDE